MNDELEKINNLIERMAYNKGFSEGVDFSLKELQLDNKQLEENRKRIIANTIDDFRERLNKEMCDLWNWYKKDKQNRPKPDFTNAIAMVDLIADMMKGELR